MNTNRLFNMKSLPGHTRLRSGLAYAAILGALLCFPASRLQAQQASSSSSNRISLSEADGTALSTDSNQGVITVNLPRTDTTVTIDARSRTFTVKNNKTGGSTPEISDFPPTTPTNSFSTGSETVTVNFNADLSVNISVSNGNGGDAVTIKQEVNPQTGEITTNVSNDAAQATSASVTIDSNGAVANTNTVTTTPGGQSFEVTKGTDGLTHIFSKNQNGQTVSDLPVGAANSVVIGEDKIPHIASPGKSTPPANVMPITQAFTTGGQSGPTMQVTGIGGSGFLNHSATASAGFDAAVLFPLGNRVQIGPAAGFDWQNSTIVKTLGGGPPPSTFLKESIGFQSKNIGGRLVLPLGKWDVALHGGVSFTDAVISQSEGFCTPTNGCTSSNADTSHHTAVTPSGGISVSHPIGLHLSVVGGADYRHLPTGSNGMNDFRVYGGLSLKFGLHGRGKEFPRTAEKPCTIDCSALKAKADAAAAAAAQARTAATAAKANADAKAQAAAAAQSAANDASAVAADPSDKMLGSSNGRTVSTQDLRLKSAASQQAWQDYLSGSITAQELEQRWENLDEPSAIDALRAADLAARTALKQTAQAAADAADAATQAAADAQAAAAQAQAAADAADQAAAAALAAYQECADRAAQQGCPPQVAGGPTTPGGAPGGGPGGGGPGGAGPGGPGAGPGGAPGGGGITTGAPRDLPPPLHANYFPVGPEKCKYETTDGYFEPTQGVWQDDTSFVDKPGKELLRTASVVYTAELPMVAGRDTVLAGVDHYTEGSGGRLIRDRDHIVLSYATNCTQAVAVKFKFTVEGSGQAPIVFYGNGIGMALIEDPKQDPPISETVKQWAYLGVPRDETFKFQNPGPYKITAELVKVSDNTPTGISMSLHGEVVRTHGPVVNFVPVQLRDNGYPNLLQNTARQMAEKVHKYVPDFYPLAPGDLPTRALGLRNFEGAGVREADEGDRVIALIAQLEDSLTAGTFLNGAGRVIAILDQQDFSTLEHGSGSAAVTHRADFHLKKAGVVLNWKLTVVPAAVKVDDVAHELVHTLPDGWSSPGMLAECGRDYHNEYNYWANGLRLVGGGDPLRREKDGALPIMGPGSTNTEFMDAPLSSDSSVLRQVLNPATGKMEDKLITEEWITQCTYWHLTKMLVKVPDPALILVRGFVSRKAGQAKGSFQSFYNVMGETDVESSEAGDWAVILRDANGVVLGRYPFTPHWSDPDHTIERDLVAFDFRVPAVPGAVQADLIGPTGLLETKDFSSTAPVIESLTPSTDTEIRAVNGRVHMDWKVRGESGKPLLYTVLYSPNNDQAYGEQSFEQTSDSFNVELAPGVKTHFVKVIASDGSHSSEKVASFTTP